MGKLYFKSIDDVFCYPLEDHLREAKDDGLTEIELVEADPDFDNPNYVWCSYAGATCERSECRKSVCPYYESKSGRGMCANRGRLFQHGETVKFEVV